MKFILFSIVCTSFLQIKSPGTDVLAGHLTNIVENYVNTYERHEADCKMQDDNMKSLLDAAMDQQNQESIFNEKTKLAKACNKVLEGKATMVKTLDEAMKTLRPNESWLDSHPELKTKVGKILTAHAGAVATAMLSKTQDIHQLELEAVQKMLE